MKATKLLQDQHTEVDELFERIQEAGSAGEKRRFFEMLAHALVAHDTIEREIFYPACEKAMGMTKLLGEALVEHGVVEFCLYEADEAQGDGSFDFKVKVLREIVEHHVEEEEDEFFPRAEKALGPELLEALGEEMEARFEEVRADDYKNPLHRNLRRVLDGTMKGDAPESARTPIQRAPAKASSRNGARKTAQAR
jgi:hypothetical protein